MIIAITTIHDRGHEKSILLHSFRGSVTNHRLSIARQSVTLSQRFRRRGIKITNSWQISIFGDVFDSWWCQRLSVYASWDVCRRLSNVHKKFQGNGQNENTNEGCEYIEMVLVTWFAIRVFKTKKLQLGKKGDMKQFKTTNPKMESAVECRMSAHSKDRRMESERKSTIAHCSMSAHPYRFNFIFTNSPKTQLINSVIMRKVDVVHKKQRI